MSYSKRYEFNDFYIPERMMGGIARYIECGIEPGSFLSAVICNDLKNSIGRADNENLQNLQAFVGYFYNEAPASCWGSPQNMDAWIACGGLAGLNGEAAKEAA